MKEYMLFIRGGDARMAHLSEEETKAHMDRWGAYMGEIAQKGHLVGGLPFTMDGKVLTTSGVKNDIVRSEGGDAIGGYLHFKADNYDQATELAKGCPVFEHDGSIEIREIMPMDM